MATHEKSRALSGPVPRLLGYAPERRGTDGLDVTSQPCRRATRGLAEGLGWFSIGLGVAELAAPDALARLIGMPPQPNLLRLYGLREIAAGAGILSGHRQAEWLGARVAGDGLDLGTLLASFGSRRANAVRLSIATVAVAGVTALDVLCAGLLVEQRRADRRRQSSS